MRCCAHGGAGGLRRPQLPSLAAGPEHHQRLAGRARSTLKGASAAPGHGAASTGDGDADAVPAESVLWLRPLPDGTDLTPGSPAAINELRESVELALTAALEHLSPGQRAAMTLREGLGFQAREVAETMNTSEASVRALTVRTAHLDGYLPFRGSAGAGRRPHEVWHGGAVLFDCDVAQMSYAVVR